MKEQDAFTITPPSVSFGGDPAIQLRPVNPGYRHAISLVEKLTDKKLKGEERSRSIGRACVLAYAAIYSLSPADAARTILDEDAFKLAVMEADQALSEEDVTKCDEYLAGVFSRTAASTVEVERPAPGKPATRGTSRNRRR